MILKILKYSLLILIGLIVLVVLVMSPFIVKARMEGERLYAKYDSYTQEALSKNFELKPYPIKAEFQELHPWKSMKLLKFVVQSQQGKKLARINSINATMGIVMKMYTLLLRPQYNYNLPMLSVDIIFIGGKRVFVIEIIDPAHIDDENKKTHYEKMRVWDSEVAKFEPMEVDMDWCKDIVTDFSIHINANRTNDDILFEMYKTFLDAYIDMTKNAEPLSPDLSQKVQDGMEGYVSSLLTKGGPAVNLFKRILGPEKQQEYVRTVMFGMD